VIFSAIALAVHCLIARVEFVIYSEAYHPSFSYRDCSISYIDFSTLASNDSIKAFDCFSATEIRSYITSLNWPRASITSTFLASLAKVKFENRPSWNSRNRLMLSKHWKVAEVAWQTGCGIFFHRSTLTDLIIWSRDSCICLGPMIELGTKLV
jgi:hypothetical protein